MASAGPADFRALRRPHACGFTPIDDAITLHADMMIGETIAMGPQQKRALETPTDLEAMAEKAREASEFLKALAQESRLLILCTLAGGEKSVGELETILAQRQSTVSQQLARLRLESLVTARRDGKTIYYSLASDKVRAVLAALYQAFCTPKGAAGG